MQYANSNMICGDIMWPLDVPQVHLTSWGVVSAILSPLVILFNVLLIMAMKKTGDTKSITANYIIIMSVSDIGIGLIVMPMIFAMVTSESARTSCSFQSATQFFAFAVGYTSFLLLIAIAVDRYIRMTLLTKYESVMNTFRMKCTVVGIVIVSFSFALLTVFYLSFPMHMAAVSMNVTFISVIYIVYTSMLCRLDKQAIPSTPPSSLKEKSRGRSLIRKRRSRRKRDIAVTKTVKILLGTIFIMYMPYNIISSIWTYYKFYKKENPGLFLNVSVFWTYIVLFLNSVANVFVYAHGNGKIRKYVVSFVRKGGRNDSSNSRSFQETSSLWKQDDKKKDQNQKNDTSTIAKV